MTRASPRRHVRRLRTAAQHADLRDLLFLARAGLAATCAGALLRFAPMPEVTRALARRGPLRLPVPDADRVVWLTDRLLATDIGPLRPNCVLRSLVLLRYLPDPVVFRVGVRPGVRPIDGHAWVERDGQPVQERTNPREAYMETWSWAR